MDAFRQRLGKGDDMVWQNYGMIVGNKFYFHGGPFGLNWDIDGLTFMQKILYVKAVCLANELAPSILALDAVDKEKNLYEINNKINELSRPEKLEEWDETTFYSNLEILLKNFYFGKRKESSSDTLQSKDGYFTKMLLDTGDLELVYVKSKDFEPADLSIMCNYGKSQMLSESNWLSNGNRLGKILMKIRDELRKEESSGKE